MKYLKWSLLLLLAALSAAAGGAKLLKMDQEVELFQSAGLDPVWMLPLGCLQILAVILALVPRTKVLGTMLISIGFLASAWIVYLTGNTSFAAFSLLPVLLAIYLAWRPISTSRHYSA